MSTPSEREADRPGLNLHEYQREAVERILREAPPLDPHAPAIGLGRMHRPGQQAPVVMVIGPRRTSYDMTAKLHAEIDKGGFRFLIIDEAFFPPLTDGVRITSAQLGKAKSFSEAIDDSLFEAAMKAQVYEEPDPEPLPAIRAQRIKPMKGSAAAQWKRERNGRGRK